MDVIPLPGLPPFPHALIGAQLDARLSSLAALGPVRVPPITGYTGPHAKVIRKHLAPLADPLVDYVPEHLRAPAFQQRSAHEADIAERLAPVTRADLADAAALQARLRAIAAGVHGIDAGFRKTPIATEPGYRGNVIAYPPAELVGPLLHMAAREISRHPGAPLGVIAAYAMLACTTVHPFIDGNGRTSRVLFNLVLRSEFPGLPYIGIKEIVQFSAGDFLIATNRVHFQKDWGPFLLWLLAILDIHLAMARPVGVVAASSARVPKGIRDRGSSPSAGATYHGK
jgi:hypothetical protein